MPAPLIAVDLPCFGQRVQMSHLGPWHAGQAQSGMAMPNNTSLNQWDTVGPI
jgi:hypothetical protein